MNKIFLVSFITSMALYANISIVSSSYQEQIKVMSSGEQVKAWIKTEKVVPGTVVRYMNNLLNNGTSDADELVINNPIPKDMVYVPDSALCESGCHVSYSIDDGLTFHTPMELYVGDGVERHIAKASEYTNIRWVIDSLLSSSESYVEYKAQLK